MFDRRLKLTIGSRSDTIATVYDEKMSINFAVNRTIEGKTADTANITIYNADEDLFDFYFDENDAYIRLECGYEGEMGTVFEGDVIFANQYFEGVNRVTSIECGDGVKAIELMNMNKGYAPNISVETVLNDIVKGMTDTYGILKSALTVKNIKSLASGKLQFGELIKGKAVNKLDDLLKGQGYKWNISNNTLNVFQDNFNEQQYKLTVNSGLIGSPRKIQTEKTGTKGSQRITGVQFDCLIIPTIVCGNTVEIESRYIKGTYTIHDMTINGQTRGNQWSQTMTGF